MGACSLTEQSFTTQAGANNGTSPPATCSYGTASAGTSTWIHFTYVGPPTQQYLLASQAPGGAGNDPAIAIYTDNGCTLLGCAADNSNVGPTEGANDGKVDLTTLGLTVGMQYFARVYNEGNTSNIKNPTLRCIPQAPCGDCFSNPCVITNINTNFSSSTNGSHFSDCCTFPVATTGAVTQLNCAGPGQVSVDGNVWYSFTVCANGIVTATISYSGCSDGLGSQIWMLDGNCSGGTATFNNLDCANNGTLSPATVSYNCTAGLTYYIMIDSYGGNICDFNVSLTGPICITSGCTTNAGANVAICSGSIATIGAPAVAGFTYSWSPTTGLSSSTSANPTVTLTNAGTTPVVYSYILTATQASPPCTALDTVLVTVNPKPVASASPQTICSGSTSSVALTSNIAGTTYTWTAPTQVGASGGTAGSGSTIAQTLTATGTTAGTVTYTITPTAGGCAGNTITVIVTVNPKPVGSATAQTICSGTATSVVLNSTIAGTTYAWTAPTQTGATGGTSGSGSTISQTLTATGAGSGIVTYTVTPTASGCSGNTFTVTVTVNPIPVITVNSPSICAGQTAT